MSHGFVASDRRRGSLREKDEQIAGLKAELIRFKTDSWSLESKRNADLTATVERLENENKSIKKRWEYKAVMEADEKLSQQSAKIRRLEEQLKNCHCFENKMTLKMAGIDTDKMQIGAALRDEKEEVAEPKVSILDNEDISGDNLLGG